MKYIKFILATALLIILVGGLYSIFSNNKASEETVMTPTASDTVTENQSEEVSPDSITPASTQTAPAPTPAQAKVLETVGIDPETVSFSPSEIACFKEVLGEARVAEILAGAVPGPVELYKAKDCLE